MIAQTENAVITMACFFTACRNRDTSHFFGHLQFDQHSDGIIVPLPTGVLEDVEVLRLYDVIRLVGYGPVLCLLAVRRSQEIDWSQYGGNYPTFFGYDFNSGQVFDVPPLGANKKSKTDSDMIVDIPFHQARWFHDMRFAGVDSYKAEWLEIGGVSSSKGGPEVVVIDPPVLDELKL